MRGPRKTHEKAGEKVRTSPKTSPPRLYLFLLNALREPESNIVDPCETISCKSFPETLEGLQLVPKLSATGFQSRNVPIGTETNENSCLRKGVIPRENGTCSLGCFNKSRNTG